MELMIAAILVKAVALLALLYVVARRKDGFRLARAALAAVGIPLIGLLMDCFLVDLIGIWTVFPFIAFVLLLAVALCRVSVWEGVVVTVVFLALGVAADRGLQVVLGGAGGTEGQAAPGGVTPDLAKATGTETGGPADRASAAPAAATAEIPAAEATPAATLPSVPGLQAPPGIPFAPPDSPGWAVSRNKLRVTATMMDRGRMVAVVNGRDVGVGSVVIVVHEKQAFPWRVGSITRGDVNWEPVLTR